MVTRLWIVLGLAMLGCIRPPAQLEGPAEQPMRLPILAPEYGASAEHPGRFELGDRLETLTLPLADAGSFAIDDAQVAGPVLLIWIGGAEHESLTAWIRTLDHSLAPLEQRGATLVFVRPLEPEAALRWATELRLQTPVASDPADQLGLSAAPLEFTVIIVERGTIVYRKLGGRRPALDELLAVLDGAAASLRCCPRECADPCERY